MASLMSTVAEIIREEIDQGIDDSLPILDPISTQAIQTAAGVYKTGIGRDWKVLHTFSGSISGSHAWRAAAGGTVAIDGSDAGAGAFTLFGTSALQTWQGVNEIASTGYIQKELTLKEGFGNFLIPLHLLRSDQLNAAVSSAVAEIVKGSSKRTALSMVHSFWKEDTDNHIGKFTSDGANLTTTNHEVTLTAGRIRSFFPGLAVQVHVASTGALPSGASATEPVWVDDVDYLAKKVSLRTRSATITMGAVAHIILPYDGATSTANTSVSPSGLNDWIKDGTESDTNVFGIDVAVHSQFRSIKNADAVALDSTVINKYIGGFNDAYGAELDCIVVSEGVMLDAVDNLDNATIQYDYGSKSPRDAQFGFSSFGYRYNGKVYKFLTSPNCQGGTMYILKLQGQNLRKYVPPRLSGAGSESKFSSQTEFVAPLMGSKNIFLPVTSADKPTNFLQAPYLNWCEYCPRMVQSVKVTTLTEANIFTG